MGEGGSQPVAGVSGQESLVLSHTSLTTGQAAHSTLQHPLKAAQGLPTALRVGAGSA